MASERRLLLGILLTLALLLPLGAWVVDRTRSAGGGQPSASRLDTRDEVTVQTFPPATPAPPLELATLDGGRLDLAGYRGRPVLLNFWATWCEPCIREFPLLRRTLDQRRPDGLVVLGVLAGGGPGEASAFVSQHGGAWPVGIDKGARAAASYRVYGVPDTVFIRRDGTMASRVLGELTQARLDAQLDLILPG